MAPKKGQTNNPHGRPVTLKPGDKRVVAVRITANEKKAVKRQQKSEGNHDPLGKYLVEKTLKK